MSGCTGFASRGVQLWNLAVLTVLFGELLDASPADLELLGNKAGVHVMINNTLTDPGDILLIKLHFTWWIVGEILPTKSLAYTTEIFGVYYNPRGVKSVFNEGEILDCDDVFRV